MNRDSPEDSPALQSFLSAKSKTSTDLFWQFLLAYKEIGPDLQAIPAKTMIGIATPRKRIAWASQFGKQFLHIYFPLRQAYEDNLCFQKIASFPGSKDYNHHLRIYAPEDINDEVLFFMRLAYEQGR